MVRLVEVFPPQGRSSARGYDAHPSVNCAVLKTTWVPLMINSNDAAKGERDFLVSPVGERCFYDP